MKNLHRSVSLVLKCLAILFLLFNFKDVVQGQKLNNKLPSVYLRFKEYVNDNDGNESARLTLRNNTIWPIIVVIPMGEALKGDVPAPYVIEFHDTGCRDERLRIDVVMSTTLKPGRTISFTAPLYDFPKGSSVYVTYSFPWEKQDNGNLRIYEPVHRAYFAAYDLPPRSKK